MGYKNASNPFLHVFVDSSLITGRGREAEEEPECEQKSVLYSTNSIKPDKGKNLGYIEEVQHEPAFSSSPQKYFLLIKNNPLKT